MRSIRWRSASISATAIGGLYQRSDEEMLAIWDVAVEETRALLSGSWGTTA